MHLIAQLWSNLWPNVFAPSVWTTLAIAWSHARQMREHEKTRSRMP